MNWLSVAEIAKQTRIPAPTARRYASLFKDFLGGNKIGRTTKYPESSVAVFNRISELYTEGRVTQEIEDILKSEVPRTIDVETVHEGSAKDAHATGFMSTMQEMIEKIASCMDVIADQKTLIEQQNEDIKKLKTAFVMLARSQKKLKALPQIDTPALAAEVVEEATKELENRTSALEEKDVELEQIAMNLSFDTSDIKVKLQILESELVRLRKDRRDMEKYLQDKIERLKEAVD